MHFSRRSLPLLLLLSVSVMASMTVWEFTNVPVPPTASIPGRAALMRPAPSRAPLPRASAGPAGPQAPPPRPVPAPPGPPARRPSPAAAAARQAARQRYLDNVYLLARLIHGEARGEPFVGQVAVGAVVMNRVESPLYPNSIPGVIYEPGAFDAVIDGQFYFPPDNESIRAAQAAISGWDPTGGALFYYNPAKTTSYWIWSRPIILVIGQHYFAR